MEVVIVDRRAADEHAPPGDLVGHFPIAGVDAGTLVGVLAVKREHVQTAGEARAADIHGRVIETELLVDFPA